MYFSVYERVFLTNNVLLSKTFSEKCSEGGGEIFGKSANFERRRGIARYILTLCNFLLDPSLILLNPSPILLDPPSSFSSTSPPHSPHFLKSFQNGEPACNFSTLRILMSPQKLLISWKVLCMSKMFWNIWKKINFQDHRDFSEIKNKKKFFAQNIMKRMLVFFIHRGATFFLILMLFPYL